MALRLALVALLALGLHTHATLVHREIMLGRSVDGRRILAIESGERGAKKVLVVGCIHGNEQAGIAVAQRLAAMAPPHGVDLWTVPVLNPDGVARDTRQNARGVDLNRNFPYRWRPLTGVYYSGPHALSEPESRIAYALINRLHPAISIWFHQHLGVVDDSGGSVAIERRFAQLVGLPLANLAQEPGSATTWQNHAFRATAFVVELHAGSLPPSGVATFGRAILAVGRG